MMGLFVLLAASSLLYLLSDERYFFTYKPDYRKDYACQAIDHHLSSFSSAMTDDLEDRSTIKQTLLSCSHVIQPQRNTLEMDFGFLIKEIESKDKIWSFYINKDLNRFYPKMRSQFVEQMHRGGLELKEPVEADSEKDAYLDPSKNVIYLSYENTKLLLSYKESRSLRNDVR